MSKHDSANCPDRLFLLFCFVFLVGGWATKFRANAEPLPAVHVLTKIKTNCTKYGSLLLENVATMDPCGTVNGWDYFQTWIREKK